MQVETMKFARGTLAAHRGAERGGTRKPWRTPQVIESELDQTESAGGGPADDGPPFHSTVS